MIVVVVLVLFVVFFCFFLHPVWRFFNFLFLTHFFVFFSLFCFFLLNFLISFKKTFIVCLSFYGIHSFAKILLFKVFVLRKYELGSIKKLFLAKEK